MSIASPPCVSSRTSSLSHGRHPFPPPIRPDPRRRTLWRIVKGLTRSVDQYTPDTGHHAERVTHLSLMLGWKLGLSASELFDLKLGALLHDVGKLLIPKAVLNKPGPLTEEEMVQVRTHPSLGHSYLLAFPILGRILPIVRHHHERWDGAGYPDGLSGHRIPYLARIVALADVFDALTSDRSYRRGLPPSAAADLLEQGTGTHFDPALVAVFLRVIPST